ncbi:MAG: polyphosphate--glucose phosphotransferase [Lapillicoccus sp.]
MAKNHVALGIDIGGSGIKGAVVDLGKGEFTTKRKKILTPQPATPEAVIEVVAQLVEHFAGKLDDKTAVGVTVPAVVQHGVVLSAANIDPTWIEFEGEKALEKRLGRDVYLVNDADAAGYAELHYGAAMDENGLVILTTLGTGIGSAILYRNVLVPNSELGHLEIDGKDAEGEAASSVKETLDLTYEEYVPRLQRYYTVVEALFHPDLFVVGGGISKEADEFLPKLKLRTPIIPATLQNKAGIIGAAVLASASQRKHGKHTG